VSLRDSGCGGGTPGLGIAHNRIAVKPDFQPSVQVLHLEGNPWLEDTSALDGTLYQ